MSVSDVSKFISGLIAMVMVLSAGISGAGDGLRIEPDQLKTKLGQPGVFIFDARIFPAWRKSDLKILGAMQ